MFFWELPEKARELRERAQRMLDTHEIAPTPINYELWFFRELGQNDELKGALDAALNNGRARDIEYARGLHDRFFSRTGTEDIDEVGSRIAAELKKLADTLQVTGEGSAAYGQTLGKAAQQLAQTEVSPQLRHIIDQVAAATVAMADKNRTLKAQVDASSKEMQTLRTQMDTLRKEGQLDGLTGLINRRGFDEGIGAVVGEAKASGKAMSLLMCDIDYFKRFNDTWGHATGDQVLRLVAQCIRSSVRDVDTAARYGGEEMAVILPGTGLEGARVVAEKIRKTVEARRIVKKSSGESLGSITLSIGVSELNDGETADDLIARADACLYGAKSAGRNRVSADARPTGHAGGSSATRLGIGSTARSGNAVLEVSFNDEQTPIFFDTALDVDDARLKRMLLWWQSLAPAGQVPSWSQELMAQVTPMRDFLYGAEVAKNNAHFQFIFFGRDIVRALGSDPSGRIISPEAQTSPALEPLLTRLREGLKLVCHLKSPVHTFAKAPHQLPTGLYDGETLAVPFQYRGVDVGFILSATILSPVGADADRRRIG